MYDYGSAKKNEEHYGQVSSAVHFLMDYYIVLFSQQLLIMMCQSYQYQLLHLLVVMTGWLIQLMWLLSYPPFLIWSTS